MRAHAELYAALLVREFPAQALLRLRKDLHKQPCIVMEGEPPVQQVVSINEKARALGIVPGMTKTEVETFSGITILRRCAREEAQTREVLLECAGRFSPRIEEFTEEEGFICVLDISGTERLLGPSQLLAKDMLACARALGIAACATIAHNFHVAVALAKGTASGDIWTVSLGQEAVALASLPLTVINLTEEQTQLFSLWGIHTLGALADLPEKSLIARMGQAGKHLLQLACGVAPHLFQPVEPTFSLIERIELDTPLELLDALLFVVNIMLDQLILRATARILALASVSIRLTLEDATAQNLTVSPAQPTNEKHIWLKLIHLELEARPPGAAILSVVLEAEPGRTSKVQLGLFFPQLPEPSRLEVTLARLRALVGDGNVGSPVLKDTNQLDGFSMEPFRIQAAQSQEIVPKPFRPAMRMLRLAEAAAVTLQGRRPIAFTFRKDRYSVENAYGPWAISGEWWAESPWRYDQWDIVARSRDGNILCCCLVHNQSQGDWRMTALYD